MKVQQTTIKEYAELISLRRYNRVFELLDQETTVRLIYLFQEDRIFGKIQKGQSKNDWNRIKLDFLTNFWYNYILESGHAATYIGSAYQQLAIFLKAIQLPEPGFINRISALYPRHFVAALRVSRHFLYPGFLALIESWGTAENTYLKHHYAAFKALKEKEERLWTKVTDKTESVGLNFYQWIYIIFLHHSWLTKEKENKTPAVLDHYIPDYTDCRVYSVLISYLISQEKHNGTENILRSVTLLLKDAGKLKSALQVIDCWKEWHSFVITELEHYAYRLNYEPKIKEDGQVVISPSDIYRESLHYAAIIRQSMFFAKLRNYANDATKNELEIIGEQIKGGKITGNELIALLYNIVPLALNTNTARVYSTVFCLSPQEEERLNEIVLLLGSLQSEAQMQYSLPLRNLQAKNRDEWFMRVHSLLSNYISLADPNANPTPLFILSEGSFRSAIAKADANHLSYDDLKELLIFNTAQIRRPFNRFDPFYDLYETPFIQIGNLITGIKSLFGVQDTGILALETYMKSNIQRGEKQKEETTVFEERVASLFVEAGFTVYTNIFISGRDNPVAGEIDILLVENDVCMLIEVKRGRLPLVPFELYQEEENVIKHATGQLQKAISALQDKKEFSIRLSENKGNVAVKVPDLKAVTRYLGCILSMYCFRDSELPAEGIVKTSFVELELGQVLEKCKKLKSGKINTFFELVSTPFIPSEFLKKTKINFEIIV